MEFLAVRRVKESDMIKLAKATGGRVISNLDDLSEKDLGSADLVHQKKVESTNGSSLKDANTHNLLQC